MNADELVKLGNNKAVLYRGTVVIFECLSMALVLGSTRKQPLKAHIRTPDRRHLYVSPKLLTLPK